MGSESVCPIFLTHNRASSRGIWGKRSRNPSPPSSHKVATMPSSKSGLPVCKDGELIWKMRTHTSCLYPRTKRRLSSRFMTVTVAPTWHNTRDAKLTRKSSTRQPTKEETLKTHFAPDSYL